MLSIKNFQNTNSFNNLQTPKQVSFGKHLEVKSIPEIPKDLKYAREAIGTLVHHFKPLADISKEVTATVPRGNGYRTAAIIGQAYNPKTTIAPEISDCFKAQEKHLVEKGDVPAMLIQDFRQAYFTFSRFIADFGQKFSDVNWKSIQK